jgi:hypothetical protein
LCHETFAADYADKRRLKNFLPQMNMDITDQFRFQKTSFLKSVSSGFFRGEVFAFG